MSKTSSFLRADAPPPPQRPPPPSLQNELHADSAPRLPRLPQSGPGGGGFGKKDFQPPPPSKTSNHLVVC